MVVSPSIGRRRIMEEVVVGNFNGKLQHSNKNHIYIIHNLLVYI